MARIIEKYLKQDLVEEEGAEHAAQILPEVVFARLSSHVHTSLQLPPDNKMSQFLLG